MYKGFFETQNVPKGGGTFISTIFPLLMVKQLNKYVNFNLTIIKDFSPTYRVQHFFRLVEKVLPTKTKTLP